MGFLDKVKATAQQVAEKAQEGVQSGQAKLSDMQEHKKLDGLLRDLGAALYLDGEGRGSADTTADITRLKSEIREMEQAGTMVEAKAKAEPAADAPPAPGSVGGAPAEPTAAAEPAPPAGDFKLDDL